MSAAKYKDAILESIDQLRKRKARPDVERICHMVERKHGLSLEDTKADLDKLVKDGIVVKVEYKGNTSYRNAEKLKTSKFRSGPMQNAKNVKEIVYRAIIALTEPGEDGRREKRLGASLKDVQKWILREDANAKIAKNRIRLQLALHRAVDANSLRRLANGKYVMPRVNRNGEAKSKVDVAANSPSQSSELDVRETRPTPSSSTTTAAPSGATTPNGKTSNPQKKGRPPKKRKKSWRKLHSIERDSPEAKRQKQESSEHREEKLKETTAMANDTVVANNPRCDFCLRTASSNKAGIPEDLLFCKDCQAKAHPSCMDYSEELAQRAKNSPWQCIDCKTCFICEDSGDADAMLFCDACDKGYHMNCHSPPIKEKPTGKWVCSTCEAELGLSAADTTQHLSPLTDTNTDGGGPSCLPTPSDSPVHFPEEHKAIHTKDTLSSAVLNNAQPTSTLPKLATTLSVSVPDASDWTIDNVVQFFAEVGFTEQAEQFREQEIDGKSLLLMKRSDVLMGLALRLGPALKIYAHVERLQTRGDTLL